MTDFFLLNTIFVYKKNLLQEMYGSSRTSTKLSPGLGSVQRNLPLVQQVLNSDSLLYYSYASDSIRYMERGQKRFELSNHLGNVLAVVSDRKLVHCSNDELMWFDAQVVSVTDYYPFGMLPKTTNLRFGSFSSAALAVEIRERSWSVSSYRYGFNGQEKDDEVSGEGNSYTAEFWQYDSRLGRRWNVDPVFKEYESPYVVFGNCPIWVIDYNGADSTLYLVNIVQEDNLGNKTSTLNPEQEKQLKNETEAILERQGLSCFKVKVISLTEKEYGEMKIDKTDGLMKIINDKNKSFGNSSLWFEDIDDRHNNYINIGKINADEDIASKNRLYVLGYSAVHEFIHQLTHKDNSRLGIKNAAGHNNTEPNINYDGRHMSSKDFASLKPGCAFETLLATHKNKVHSYLEFDRMRNSFKKSRGCISATISKGAIKCND